MTKVALLYGGTSLEHEVSVMSAKNVRAALEAAKFEVLPVFITKDGEWQLKGESLKGRELMLSLRDLCDVAFPLTHGTYGEDGSLQGLLEILKVPYVGCDVIGSGVCFDKELTKRVLRDNGLPIIDFLVAASADEVNFTKAVQMLGETLFVKPARQGSSVGVNKATNEHELRTAVTTALDHDYKVLIERASNGREIEFAILEEHGQITVSPPGEIVVEDGFYDYDNKYVTDKAQLKAPTDVSERELVEGRKIAEDAFRALQCRGMARVDFFLEDGHWAINEINTIPGFTNISMYPKLFEVGGIPQSELVKRLVMAAKK